MNYYQPLEVIKNGEPSGKWHYTVTNDGRSVPVGYCAQGKCDHATPDEARKCFRGYQLEQRFRVVEGGTWTNCDACDKPAKRAIEIDGWIRFHLCADHDAAQYAADHYEVGDMISSY